MKWWQISTLLCVYGFFKEFRPSEPFISPYLTSFKNFTVEEVNEEIYPVGTYSYLSLLIAVFLLTDYLRYTPVLITGGVAGVITWSLLIWGTTLREMQILEFFYGFFMASDVAYCTYIYAKVDKQHYQKVTSHTKAASLLGRAGSGLSSQLLVYYSINYLQLNYFTIFFVAVTIPVALFLPSVSQSLYFHHKEINGVPGNEEVPKIEHQFGFENAAKDSATDKFKKAFLKLRKDFIQAFTNLYVVQWSLWWAVATCGYLQASSYCQLLWENIIKEDKVTLYHGYTDFVASIGGAAAAFGIGYLKASWDIWGQSFLGSLTIIQGCLLFYSAYLTNLYIAYTLFIIYKVLFDIAITVATYEVAKCINKDSYALVFGINTTAALVLQSILTAVVIYALKMNIRNQFRIYGGYYIWIGCGFLICGIYTLFFRRRRSL